MSITVTQLVGYIKNRFDTDPNLQGLLVSGEISNFHRQFTSGHLYFTLKDEHASISCVMFKSAASLLDFEPNNGDKVLLKAKASVFEQSGQMQLYVFSMKRDGLGDLFTQYEELKKKLNALGYFNSEHKKELKTRYLERVCVLVGDKSAAMSDIRTCFRRRWPLCKVDYVPVLVQGNDAANDIVNKLLEVDKLNYEVIILARGGGSFEDLFCFNDEKLVKTIYDMNTFVITGIGHEQDFTLADFAADLRAPTPTAAVELITADIKETRELLSELCSSECFLNPSTILEKKQMMLDYYSSKLQNFSSRITRIEKEISNSVSAMKLAMNRLVKMKELEVNEYNLEMKKMLDSRIQNTKTGIGNMTLKMNHFCQLKYNKVRNETENLGKLLESYSKDNVLKRGYTLIKSDGHYIKNINSLENKNVDIEFIDGTAKAEVKEIWKK